MFLWFLVFIVLSGSGSSQQATSSLASSFLEFLQDLQGELHLTDGTLRSLSILDVGCGWGEWLPAMLVKAIGEAKLENLIYFGIDIAEKPIHSLQARFRDFHFAAAWMIFDVVFFFFKIFVGGDALRPRGQKESTKWRKKRMICKTWHGEESDFHGRIEICQAARWFFDEKNIRKSHKDSQDSTVFWES